MDEELYQEVEKARRHVEQESASPDSAELGNLLIRAENMLRWGYPLRALQAYLRCLSKQVYFSEAHYECPPSLTTIEIVGNIASLFHHIFPSLADQCKPGTYERGLAKYLKEGALGISMHCDVGMIVPMISLADYLAAQPDTFRGNDSAKAVQIYFSALSYLQANPVSILKSVTKALTKHYVNVTRRYNPPQEYRIELEAVMPLINRGFNQFERTLGSDNPTFMELRHRLAHTYLECDMEKDGEDLLTLLLQRSEKVFGPAHEQTKGLLESLIYYYWDQDRFVECDALIRRVLQNGGRIGGDTQSSFGGFTPWFVPSLEKLGVPAGHGWAWDDRRLWLDPPETIELMPVYPSDPISVTSNNTGDNAEYDTNIFRYSLNERDDKKLVLTVPYVPYKHFQQSLESVKSGTYQDFIELISCYHHSLRYRPQHRSFLDQLPCQGASERRKSSVWTLSMADSKVCATQFWKASFWYILGS